MSGTSQTHSAPTTTLLDNIFNKYGWFKHSFVRNTITYVSKKEIMSHFMITHLFDNTYKVSFPIKNSIYNYVTNVNSVFELLDYVENVLESQEKKNK